MGEDFDKQNQNKQEPQSEDQETYQSPFSAIFFVQSNQPHQVHQSQFKQKYFDLTGLVNNLNQEYIPPNFDCQTQTRLFKLNISYHPGNFSNFKAQIYQKTKSGSIVELKVLLSYFTLNLLILNKSQPISLDNLTGHCKVIESGFGKIVFKTWERGKIDGGTFKYNDIGNLFGFTKKIIIFEKVENQFKYEDFHKAILEYCFCKLAYGLGIGPKIELMFGFDMICYQNCVLFFMEECKPIKNNTLPLSFQQLSTHMIQALKIIHSLKIIHNDIKCQNIMYSQDLKKSVFIDFGISQCIKQPLGQKTLTTFKGSYHYVSDEMKSLFMTKKGLIDMYWNDLHSLKLTLEIFQSFYLNRAQSPKSTSQNTSSYEQYEYNDKYFYQARNVSLTVNVFEQYTNMFEGNMLIQTLQDAKISKVDVMGTQMISYQLFYLLYIKNIDDFRGCICPRNYVTHSQRAQLIPQVMSLLDQLQQCPIYYEIRFENYSSFQTYLHYDLLKYQDDNQLINSDSFSHKLQKDNQIQKQKLKIIVRYQNINGETNLKKQKRIKWTPLFALFIQEIVKMRQKYTCPHKKVINEQFLPSFSQIECLKYKTRKQLSLLLVHGITVALLEKKLKVHLAFQIFCLFRLQILHVLYKILFEQTAKKENSILKNKIKEHLKWIVSENQDINLNDKKFKKDIEHLVFVIILKCLEQNIYKKQFIQVIKEQQIPLYLNIEGIHYRLKKINTEQQIRLIILINYINQKSLEDALRVIREIDMTFYQQYRIEAKLFCLLSFMKSFVLFMSYKKNMEILKQIKKTAVIVKQRLKNDLEKGQYPKTRIKNVKNHIFYDIQSSPEYIDFMIECLELQVLVNKGLADYNCHILQKRVNSAIQNFRIHFPNGSTNNSLRQQELNFNILKIILKDQMKCYQDCHELGKIMYQVNSKGMNKKGIGPIILYKSYFQLGLQQKRITSSKLYSFNDSGILQRKLDVMAKNKSFGFSLSKLVTEEKIQLMFFERFNNLNDKDVQKCKYHLNQLVQVIKNIDFESTIINAGISCSKGSLTTTLFKMVHQMEVKCIQNQVFYHLKQIISQIISQGDLNNFHEESLLIVNQVVETIIKLVYVDNKKIKKQFMEYVLELYEQTSRKLFGYTNSSLSVSYWILKIMLDYNYHQKMSIPNKKIQIQLIIIHKLNQTYNINQSLKHLEFIMHFVQNMSFYTCQPDKYGLKYTSNQLKYINHAIKSSITTITYTKRQHMLFLRPNFTINSLMVLYQHNQLYLILNIIQEMIRHINKFPGQTIVDSFCVFYQFIQSFQLASSTLVFLTAQIFKAKKYKFEEYVPLVLLVLNKSLSMDKMDSEILTIKYLKNFTIRFHKLSRYMKGQFKPKYMDFFLNLFSTIKIQNKKRLLSIKLMRTSQSQIFNNCRNSNSKQQLKRIDKLNVQTSRRSIGFYSCSYKNYRQKSVQTKIFEKVDRLFLIKRVKN